MNPDGSLYDVTLVIVVGTFVTILLSGFIILFFITYKNKFNEHRKEVQKITEEFNRALMQTQLEIKEQTLHHIAFELHDNLGQLASLIKIHLNTLQLDNPASARRKIEETKELVRQMINGMKTLSISLNSDWIVRHGLLRGLETEVEKITRLEQFQTELRVEGTAPTLAENTTLILYRMAQEIINNIIKHSNGKRIGILFSSDPKLLRLVFEDDGVGFDPVLKQRSGGSGLSNLESRSKLINAEIFIRSELGKGTVVSIELQL